MGEPYIIDALRGKHLELVGLVSHLDQQLARHRASLTHLDATMRLFDPAIVPQEIGSTHQARASWFRPRECLRLIYDVLRDAPCPVATRELVERVIAAKDIAVVDERSRALIHKTILASLTRAKATIERIEAAGVVSWRVCQAA